MKKTIFGVFLFYVFAASSTASSTEWEIRYDEPQGTLDIHSSSIYPRTRIEQKGNRKTRTRISYRSVQTDANGRRFMSVESIDTFSCANRTKTPIANTKYEGKFGKGRIVEKSISQSGLPVRIAPGSTDELILGEANCDLLTGRWATVVL